MVSTICKTIVAIAAVFSIGYGAECPLNAKLDEELCILLNEASATDIIKFIIFFDRPVIQTPEKTGTDADKEFAKYLIDTLTRYLEANKTIIYSLLNDHVIYKNDPSDTLIRLTESNVLLSFGIPAAGTQETILSLANASDFIVLLEPYIEEQPLEIKKSTKQYNLARIDNGRMQKIICYDLNGRVIGKQTIVPKNGKYSMPVNIAPSQYIFSVKDGKQSSKQRIVILP